MKKRFETLSIDELDRIYTTLPEWLWIQGKADPDFFVCPLCCQSNGRVDGFGYIHAKTCPFYDEKDI